MKHKFVAVLGTFAASLVFAQGGFDGPGRYEIKNVQNGKVLQVDPREQTTVVQASPVNREHQFWDVQPVPGGFFVLHNAINGRVLQLFRNSNKSQMVVAPPDDRNRGQLWRIQPSRDGNAMIVSSFGWTLDVPGGTGGEGARLQVYDQNGGGNQVFVFRRIGGDDRRDEPRRDEPRRDMDRDRDRDGDRADDRTRPDRFGRYWDDRDQMWKVAGDGACLYPQPDFRGEAVCTRVGFDLGEPGRQFQGQVASVRLFGHAQSVLIFELPGFRGEPFRIMHDEPDLRRGRGRVAMGFGLGSLRVN